MYLSWPAGQLINDFNSNERLSCNYDSLGQAIAQTPMCRTGLLNSQIGPGWCFLHPRTPRRPWITWIYLVSSHQWRTFPWLFSENIHPVWLVQFSCSFSPFCRFVSVRNERPRRFQCMALSGRLLDLQPFNTLKYHLPWQFRPHTTHLFWSKLWRQPQEVLPPTTTLRTRLCHPKGSYWCCPLTGNHGDNTFNLVAFKCVVVFLACCWDYFSPLPPFDPFLLIPFSQCLSVSLCLVVRLTSIHNLLTRMNQLGKIKFYYNYSIRFPSQS